jgi:hypothetical protein
MTSPSLHLILVIGLLIGAVDTSGTVSAPDPTATHDYRPIPCGPGECPPHSG